MSMSPVVSLRVSARRQPEHDRGIGTHDGIEIAAIMRTHLETRARRPHLQQRPWSIRRQHALLAVEGGVFPLLTALPPTAFLDQEKAGAFRARFDLRLRGGGRTVMVFDRGSFTLDEGRAHDVDAHISADPAALMLVFIGRQGIAKPLLGGRLVAWGRQPWKLARMLAVISPP
jgi:hypothetical protein